MTIFARALNPTKKGRLNRKIVPSFRQIAPTLAIALLILFERTAAACPFCGGSGDKGDGILPTLVVAAVVGFGARAGLRALSRKQAGHPPEPPRVTSPRSCTPSGTAAAPALRAVCS